LITARWFTTGAGTQNEGLVIGGYRDIDFSCTEEYNGTSWATGGALIVARRSLGAAGTQNAGLAFGGTSVPSSATEAYNGTSWSACGGLITGRQVNAGAGTQTLALAIGSITEEYSFGLQMLNCCL
jgi:hypothetical protein